MVQEINSLYSALRLKMFEITRVLDIHRRTSKSIYLVRPSSFIDLSYGERREAKKRGQPVPPPRPLNKSFANALAGEGRSKKDGSPHRNKSNGESPRTGRHARHGSPQSELYLKAKSSFVILLRRTSKSIYLVRPSSFIDLSYGERREAKKRGQPVPPPRPLNKSFANALAGEGRSKKDGSPHRNKSNGESPRTGRHARHGSPQRFVKILIPQGSFNNRKPPREPASSPAVIVTRIATPPNKLTTSQANSDSKRTNAGKREVIKDNVQPQGNSSEFASMWKELKMKENSPPSNAVKEKEPKDEVEKNEITKSGDGSRTDMNDIDQKEKTQALCDLLKIGRHSPSESKEEPAQNHPANEGKSADQESQGEGRSLSVEELFKTQAVPVAKAPSVPMNRPPISSGPLPSQVLVNLCVSRGQPLPRFYYGQGPQGGIFATVELANGQKFNGTLCRDQMEATESACAIALSVLNRMGQPLAMHRMPGQPFPLHPSFPPPPMMHVQQAFSPNQIMRLPHGHVDQRAATAPPAMSPSASKSLDPTKSPFIPMQVTRRNLPVKAESSQNESTEKTELEKNSEASTPSKITDILQDKVPPTSPPMTILMTPSSFESKGSQQKGASQDGTPSINSLDGITEHDLNNVPGSCQSLIPEESQSKDSKDFASDNSKKATQKKSVRKSQRTMAANFTQKK
ncbi:hypothetical protein AC249_AIPGENE12307 [Exaiptasia diaphana]|nr:hypothetical protein AC249_AIPGENE12307 [Exaiptasia diaphana]